MPLSHINHSVLTVRDTLRHSGYAFLKGESFACLSAGDSSFQAFRAAYRGMPVDPHLNAGEGERTRMYARMAIHSGNLQLYRFPHGTFFQSKTYDVLYGDIQRNFPPLSSEVIENSFFKGLLREDFVRFPIEQERKQELYEISVHLIRIAASKGSKHGRPAPEGIHRDGYDFAGIHFMDRQNIRGAENRIHALDRQVIDRHTFLEPMESCLFDDRKIFHSVQPFVSMNSEQAAYRDMLILLYQPLSHSPQKRAIPIPI